MNPSKKVSHREIKSMPREVLSDSARILLVESDLTGVKEDVAQLLGRFDQFTRQINEWRQQQGKINLPVILGFVGVVITGSGVGLTILMAALSVFWFMINSNVANVMNPIKTEVAANTAQLSANTQNINTIILPKLGEVTAQNAQSLQDRIDLRGLTNRMNDRIGANEGKVVEHTQNLKEIETQFRSNDEARNIQFSEQQRKNTDFQNTLSLLKAPMPPAPTAPFYQPQIARPDSHSNHPN